MVFTMFSYVVFVVSFFFYSTTLRRWKITVFCPKALGLAGRCKTALIKKHLFLSPTGEKEREKVRDKEPSEELSQLTAKAV